jgi:hypothetical protein
MGLTGKNAEPWKKFPEIRVWRSGIAGERQNPRP